MAGHNGVMPVSFRFRLAASIPSYDLAQSLAEGVRLFDDEAFVHIKESHEDTFWDIHAMFNLSGGDAQYLVLRLLFENAVDECGGREIVA